MSVAFGWVRFLAKQRIEEQGRAEKKKEKRIEERRRYHKINKRQKCVRCLKCDA